MKRWWRLELNARGKVVSCVAVEHGVGEDGAGFIYVLARDQHHAGRLAWNEYCRRQQAARRRRLAAEGKCQWCGRTADRGRGKRCTSCLRKDGDYRDRKAARDRGEDVPVLDRREALQERRDEARLAVLLEVLEQWQDTPTNGGFTRWLTGEIDKLRKLQGAA